MQENQNKVEAALNDAPTAPAEQEQTKTRPALKRNGLNEEARKKGEEIDKENKPPMSKEDTIKFYEDNLPFMRMQDEFETLRYNFEKRRIDSLELQVRELQALGYLAEWEAGQKEAQRRKENEDKMKAEWDAMSDEEKEQWKEKAKRNMRIMEMQAKGTVKYDGTNAGDILSFVTGELNDGITVDSEDKKFSFQIPDASKPGELTTLSMLPGQTISRTEGGEFIVL